MRVLHVIPSLSATSGGPSFALPAMAESLHHRGIHVTVVTTDDHGRGLHIDGITCGVPITREFDSIIYFPKQTEFYKCSLPMYSWLSEHIHEFDLVHIHAVFSFSSLMAGRVAARNKVPYIVRPLGVLNRWGMENRRRLLKSISFRLFDFPFLKKAAAMHYTSRMEMEEVSRFGLHNIQCVIPVGLDLEPFRQLPPRQIFSQAFPETANTRNLLYLSRIDAKKGLDLLIPAFAQISRRHADIRLVVCGGGDPAYLEKLKAMASDLGISQKVTWTGPVNGDLRLSALAAAEIFVLPSYSENFGIALLEAMAAGLPCVSTDQVALAVEVAGRNAVRMSPLDSKAMAAVLEELLISAAERQALASAAKAVAEKDYSLPAMGSALEHLYLDVASRAT